MRPPAPWRCHLPRGSGHAIASSHQRWPHEVTDSGDRCSQDHRLSTPIPRVHFSEVWGSAPTAEPAVTCKAPAPLHTPGVLVTKNMERKDKRMEEGCSWWKMELREARGGWQGWQGEVHRGDRGRGHRGTWHMEPGSCQPDFICISCLRPWGTLGELCKTHVFQDIPPKENTSILFWSRTHQAKQVRRAFFETSFPTITLRGNVILRRSKRFNISCPLDPKVWLPAPLPSRVQAWPAKKAYFNPI